MGYGDRVVAINTESVCIGRTQRRGVAKVSMVEKYTNEQYNAYIYRTNITDYRTISPRTLELRGRSFAEVKEEVMDFIRGAILVGHSIHYDLSGLGITVRPEYMRDISRYWPFTKATYGKIPSLELLAHRFLNKRIRSNGHNSCMENAHTIMQLYRLVANRWEDEMSDFYSDESSECYDSEDSSDGYY